MYAITKVLDGKNDLVYYYVDICAPIYRNGEYLALTDWYLDVLKLPNKKAELKDEDEFNAAIAAGFLSKEEIQTAKKTAKEVMDLLDSGKIYQ